VRAPATALPAPLAELLLILPCPPPWPPFFHLCSQWSWPINLPAQFFGIFPTGVLRNDAAGDTPWAGELEQKVFESSVGIGPYIEVAFFHKRSRTLLVTDAVVSVPTNPPEVRTVEWGWGGVGREWVSLFSSAVACLCFEVNQHPLTHPNPCSFLTSGVCPPLQLVPPESLLSAAARNFFINVLAGDLAAQPVDGVPLEPRELTPAARSLGWRRMALQILYIVPGDLRDPQK
jgi:hypothetical protein